VWSSPLGGPIPWFLAVAGAFLTSVYTARMLLLVFFGPARTEPHGHSGFAMKFPLQVLILLAFAGGWLWWPHLVAHIEKFPHAMASALPAPGFPELSGGRAWLLFLGAELVVIAGLLYGIAFYRKKREAPAEGRLARGLGFDATYDLLLVRPYRILAALLQRDPAEMLPGAAAGMADAGNKVLSSAQDGRLRWYIGLLAGGAVFLLIVFFAGFLRG
jgi:NADH-quinone oxidoreductase subunit L